MKYSLQWVSTLSLIGLTFSFLASAEDTPNYFSRETEATNNVNFLISEIVQGPNPGSTEHEVRKQRTRAIEVIRDFLDHYRGGMHETNAQRFRHQSLERLAESMAAHWSKSDSPVEFYEEILSKLGKDIPVGSLLKFRARLLVPEHSYLPLNLLIDRLISIQGARQIQLLLDAEFQMSRLPSLEETHSDRLETVQGLPKLLSNSGVAALAQDHPADLQRLARIFRKLDYRSLGHILEVLPILKREVLSEAGCEAVLEELKK